ncbi:MAG: hypothetical protein WCO84_01170 [bacterium]
MIFITRDKTDKPLFTAYVNGITEKTLPNGGKIKHYILGTQETKKDGTKVYSSWFCGLMGNARKQEEITPLEKGNLIKVYGFKQTNISRKNDDGSFGKAFLDIQINEYSLYEANNTVSGNSTTNDEDNPF